MFIPIRLTPAAVMAWVREIPMPLPLVLMLACIAGCAGPYQTINDGRMGRQDIGNHLIVVDGQGRPRDPLTGDSNGRVLSMTEYRRKIKNILSAMRTFHEGKPEKKILIFVHGGLNDPANSYQSADREIQPIMDAGYYPIFLNWDSGLDTYGEHIFSLTQGLTDDNNPARALIAPIYVLADAGRALLRAPALWSTEVGNDILAVSSDLNATGKPRDKAETVRIDQADNERWANRHRGKVLANAFKVLRCRQLQEKQNLPHDQAPQQLQISIGPDLGFDEGRMTAQGISYVITSPFKFALAPLIDFIGTPSWHVMGRRTLLAFDGRLGGDPGEPPYQPEICTAQTRRVKTRSERTNDATDFDSTGAFDVFREALLATTRDSHAETQPCTNPALRYEVTLVAHSAGTLVLNEWLRRDMLEEKDQVYSNIVYLAAACSVRDFERAVVPYLIRHCQTHFYNLMLHPLADLRETGETGDIPPRGSLPTWLDDFLTNPQTPIDRTLGRWDNIVPAVESIPTRIRGQITLKAFTLAPYDRVPPPNTPNYGPQVHGDFRGAPYWRPDFWTSESPIVP